MAHHLISDHHLPPASNVSSFNQAPQSTLHRHGRHARIGRNHVHMGWMDGGCPPILPSLAYTPPLSAITHLLPPPSTVHLSYLTYWSSTSVPASFHLSQPPFLVFYHHSASGSQAASTDSAFIVTPLPPQLASLCCPSPSSQLKMATGPIPIPKGYLIY